MLSFVVVVSCLGIRFRLALAKQKRDLFLSTLVILCRGDFNAGRVFVPLSLAHSLPGCEGCCVARRRALEPSDDALRDRMTPLVIHSLSSCCSTVWQSAASQWRLTH